MLEARNVGCVRGDRSIFNGINFTLSPGTLLQVQGSNGSGKTSLLRIICGLLTPETGEVLWEGANIRTLDEDYSQHLTYIGHRHGLKEELTPLENLQISSGLLGHRINRDQAIGSLKQMGLGGRETLPARFLSEGQRRRSTLARLVNCNKPLWVLDEVLASLDADAVSLIQTIIEKHLVMGGIAVVATHQQLNISSGSFQRLDLS